MNNNMLFIILVLSIVITVLGSITLFSYLGISFRPRGPPVLRRAALVIANNNEKETIMIK